MNLNLEPSQLASIDQPATSLNLMLAHRVDDETFLQQLLEAFFEEYLPFLHHGFRYIRQDYCGHCAFLGQELTISQPGGLLRGIATTVNLDGALELWTDDGVRHVVVAGDALATPC